MCCMFGRDDCASGVPERLLAVAISFRSCAAKLLVDITASAWHAAWKTYRRATLVISEQVYEICKLTRLSFLIAFFHTQSSLSYMVSCPKGVWVEDGLHRKWQRIWLLGRDEFSVAPGITFSFDNERSIQRKRHNWRKEIGTKTCGKHNRSGVNIYEKVIYTVTHKIRVYLTLST